MSDLTYRPLAAGEFDLFHAYPIPPAPGIDQRSRSFDQDVAAGRYRPEWTWVALRDDKVVARAAFWGPPEASYPYLLDRFDPGVGPDRTVVGAGLLRAAYAALADPDRLATPDGSPPPQPAAGRPEYHLFLPAGWRDRADARSYATDRITAAEHAGLRHFVQRLNLRWTPTDGLPPRSTRLRFAAADDAQTVEVLDRICVNTLDAYARRDVARHGRRRAAELTLEEFAELPSPRHWWRVAYDRTGDLVGIVVPTYSPVSATIAYLGVVPEHRGNHYSDDLVVEALHIFTDAGYTRVDDATDVGNHPMAAAFARVGYQVVGHRVVMT